MHHSHLTPALSRNGSEIKAMLSAEAAHRMARSSTIEAQLVLALDARYGEKGWFMYWDEDQSGRPIRGTRTLCFGGETLVVG